jgi:hypothetical protein
MRLTMESLLPIVPPFKPGLELKHLRVHHSRLLTQTQSHYQQHAAKRSQPQKTRRGLPAPDGRTLGGSPSYRRPYRFFIHADKQCVSDSIMMAGRSWHPGPRDGGEPRHCARQASRLPGASSNLPGQAGRPAAHKNTYPCLTYPMFAHVASPPRQPLPGQPP